jgi:hypothetical protein
VEKQMLWLLKGLRYRLVLKLHRSREHSLTHISYLFLYSPSPSPEPDEHDSLAEGEDDLDKNSNYEGSGGQHNLPRGNETARREATQIVLLRNMVGPGEVDDMLQHETADECGKYGKVERCLIFEVKSQLF